MGSLAEAIKIVAEKHLIPTILSLVVAAIIFAFTPTDYWLIEKFSPIGFWLFIAGAIFILIQFLIWMKKTILQINHWLVRSKRNAKYQQKQNQERLERFWTFLDSFSQEDINYLKQFLENENNPIIVRGICPRGYLFNSEYVLKQVEYDNQQGHFSKYILKENFYRDLRTSVEQYGKINHFLEYK